MEHHEFKDNTFIMGVCRENTLNIVEELLGVKHSDKHDEMFDAVIHMNHAFGNFNELAEPESENLNDLAGKFKKQAGLVLEEAKETADATNNSEYIDGICDFFVVYYGLVYLDPIDLGDRFEIAPRTVEEYEKYSDLIESGYSPNEALKFLMVDLSAAISRLEKRMEHGITYPQFVRSRLEVMDAALALAIHFITLTTMPGFYRCFEHVMEANMSKLVDPTVHKDPLKKYQDIGVPVELEESMVTGENGKKLYIIRVTETVTKEGKIYPKGKFLKGPGFFEPKFEYVATPVK